VRQFISAFVKKLLLESGHYSRRLATLPFPGVAVLCYHGVRPDDLDARNLPFRSLHVRASEFEEHCSILSRLFHPISVQQWISNIKNGTSLPARPVLATFDDGYRNIFTVARPILERHQIPALIFACSEPVIHRRLQWYDVVARVHGEGAVEELKKSPFAVFQSRQQEWHQRAEESDPCALMTVDELRTLSKTPGFEIGGHSAEHPILSRLSREEQRKQIFENKAALESWTGRSVETFAYPNGGAGDYDENSVSLLRECGFKLAFTTRPGFATNEEPDFEKSRFFMVEGISGPELAHRLTYTWRSV